MAKDAELKFPYQKLDRMLDQVGGRETMRQLERAMAKVGDIYEAEAVALAPVKTGFLQNSTRVQTGRWINGIRTVIAFTANYAAEVHELPPAARGKKTREKPATKFGVPGPKFLERVLRGMDFEYFIGRAFRQVLKEAAAKRRKK